LILSDITSLSRRRRALIVAFVFEEQPHRERGHPPADRLGQNTRFRPRRGAGRRTDELRCEPADDGDVDVAWASPGFWSQAFLPVPKTGAFDDAQPQDPALDASIGSACNAASEATSTRLRRHPHRHARGPIQHIHSGSLSQRSEPGSSRRQRTTTSAASRSPSKRKLHSQTTDARDSAPRGLRSCGRSVVALYNQERPHLGYRNQGRRPWKTVERFVSQSPARQAG
jgi:hypothetical protein